MALVAGIIFAFLTLVLRLEPHSPNFVPVAALALWAGAYLPRKIGFVFPLAVMFVSDAFIGFYDWRLMIVVYASFAAIIAVGWWVGKDKSLGRIFLASLAGSVLFYLATNFGVWALSSWYPKTAGGLADAYLLAIPFFRNTLAGDLFFNGVFFGSYALALFLSRLKTPEISYAGRPIR
ncbi:MAG TPA: DUF6580 family putative transport protein [Candidatus Tyrphobacter sp.]|nr:DUF6580 family putative transport protein [Candidatus Tyrphobacter sp.]